VLSGGFTAAEDEQQQGQRCESKQVPCAVSQIQVAQHPVEAHPGSLDHRVRREDAILPKERAETQDYEKRFHKSALVEASYTSCGTKWRNRKSFFLYHFG
jgi:hypothetical protein